jgi:hypothetical protein
MYGDANGGNASSFVCKSPDSKTNHIPFVDDALKLELGRRVHKLEGRFFTPFGRIPSVGGVAMVSFGSTEREARASNPDTKPGNRSPPLQGGDELHFPVLCPYDTLWLPWEWLSFVRRIRSEEIFPLLGGGGRRVIII